MPVHIRYSEKFVDLVICIAGDLMYHVFPFHMTSIFTYFPNFLSLKASILFENSIQKPHLTSILLCGGSLSAIYWLFPVIAFVCCPQSLTTQDCFDIVSVHRLCLPFTT